MNRVFVFLAALGVGNLVFGIHIAEPLHKLIALEMIV